MIVLILFFLFIETESLTVLVGGSIFILFLGYVYFERHLFQLWGSGLSEMGIYELYSPVTRYYFRKRVLESGSLKDLMKIRGESWDLGKKFFSEVETSPLEEWVDGSEYSTFFYKALDKLTFSSPSDKWAKKTFKSLIEKLEDEYPSNTPDGSVKDAVAAYALDHYLVAAFIKRHQAEELFLDLYMRSLLLRGGT